MYEQRFGLHRKPFQTVTKAQDFFASSSFNELLPNIVHALQTDLGVAVLTGPAGVGKSVSLEQIQRNLESTAQTLLLRGGSVKGPADLLYLLHRRLLKLQPDSAAVPNSSTTEIVRRYEVVERLERVASFWGPLTILLDDAQLVNQDVFSELRSLLEEGHDGRRFARLLIAGPLLLEEVLADSANSHFARKIRTHSFLQPLRSDESIRYLDHHFSLAGGQLSEAFASDALELIAAAADGVPLCLNLLADESLMLCEENDWNEVTRDSVKQALTRLQHLPYSWNVSMVEDSSDDDSEGDDYSAGSNRSVAVNAIEIGEFPSDSFSGSENDSAISNATEGVFEIGAPPQSVEIDVAGTVMKETAFAHESASSENEAKSLMETETVSELQTETSEPIEAALETFEHQEADTQSVEIETTLWEEPSPETIDPQTNFEAAIEISQEEFFASEDQQADGYEATLPTQLLANVGCDDVSGLAEFVDGEDEGHSSEASSVGASELADSITHYEPWAPAGQWPATPLTLDDTSQSELPATVTAEPADLQDAEGESSDVAFAEPIWDTAATPVVDRFTWAELGRSSVAGDPAIDENDQKLVDPDSTLPFAAAWPPVTTGVAPSSQIPVSELDDDYAELLNDLGLLIDATAGRVTGHEAVAAESHVQTPSMAVVSSRPGELLSSSPGPEGTIEELQQLIQKEQQLDEVAGRPEDFPQMQSADSAAEENSLPTDVQTGQSFSDSYPATASPQFFSMGQAEEVDETPADGTPPSGAQSSNLHLNQNAPHVLGEVGSSVFEDPDPDVVAFQQIVEERDEWLLQEELLSQIVSDEQAAQEKAMPNMLRQARRHQQHSVLTMGLRQAAGAETVTEASKDSNADLDNSVERSVLTDQDHPISLPMPDAISPANEGEGAAASPYSSVATQDPEKAGFTNLFTRLRRRRGKAS